MLRYVRRMLYSKRAIAITVIAAIYFLYIQLHKPVRYSPVAREELNSYAIDDEQDIHLFIHVRVVGAWQKTLEQFLAAAEKGDVLTRKNTFVYIGVAGNINTFWWSEVHLGGGQTLRDHIRQQDDSTSRTIPPRIQVRHISTAYTCGHHMTMKWVHDKLHDNNDPISKNAMVFFGNSRKIVTKAAFAGDDSHYNDDETMLELLLVKARRAIHLLRLRDDTDIRKSCRVSVVGLSIKMLENGQGLHSHQTWWARADMLRELPSTTNGVAFTCNITAVEHELRNRQRAVAGYDPRYDSEYYLDMLKAYQANKPSEKTHDLWLSQSQRFVTENAKLGVCCGGDFLELATCDKATLAGISRLAPQH